MVLPIASARLCLSGLILPADWVPAGSRTRVPTCATYRGGTAHSMRSGHATTDASTWIRMTVRQIHVVPIVNAHGQSGCCQT